LLSSAKLAGINPAQLSPQDFALEDRFMLSKLNSTITHTTELYEKYRLNEIPWAVEELYLSLSRDYIRLVRDKLNLGEEAEKQKVLYVMYSTLMGTIKLFAPICPYITESIYQNFRKEFGLEEESIHLNSWPKPDTKLIDESLEKDFLVADTIVQKLLYARDKMAMGVRWPLSEAIVVTKDEDTKKAVEHLSGLIRLQTNIKSLKVQEQAEIRETVRTDYEKLRKDYGGLTALIIANLSRTTPETILTHIKESGSYEFEIENNAKVAIKMDHLLLEKEAPDGFVMVDFSKGDLLLNKKLTPELEAEGFSRELVRRVQEQRKQSGFSKSDRIELYVIADQKLKQMLEKHNADIMERVGASRQTISDVPPLSELKFSKEIEIRDKKLKILFDRIEQL